MLPDLSKKLIISIGMVSIFSLVIGGMLLMTFNSRVFVLEGDHTFESDYIVPRGRTVIFKEGIFSFTKANGKVIVYGTFQGIQITLQGNIEAFGDSKVTLLDSPHTVDEIYAYNSSSVTVINSTVNKIYLYDLARVTVDDTAYSSPTTIYGSVQALINQLNATLLDLEENYSSLQGTIDQVNYTLANVIANSELLNTTMISIDTILSEDLSTLNASLQALDARITALENWQTPNYDSAPFTADPAHKGYIYFNNLENKLYYCDGTQWLALQPEIPEKYYTREFELEGWGSSTIDLRVAQTNQYMIFDDPEPSVGWVITWSFDILVTGCSGEYIPPLSAGYHIQGVIEYDVNAKQTAFVGSAVITTLGEDISGWYADLIIWNPGDKPGGFTVLAFGGGYTVSWAAYVKIVESSQ
ncbi:MAG: hypothetical protein ACFFAJ_11930 [Candidatus Hodarchaeota archaeon]